MIDIALANEAWEGVDASTEALVDAWLVREGERVVAGQPLVKVVLVKTSYEVPAPANGIVERILVPAEQTFAHGRSLGTLREG